MDMYGIISKQLLLSYFTF